MKRLALAIICAAVLAVPILWAAHGTTPSFAVVGDLHLPVSDFDESWVDAINATGADRLFVVGDVVHGPRWREGWARFDTLVSGLDMPVHVVCGNHDVDEPGALEFWRGRYGRDYDVLADGGTRYVVLNTELAGAERAAMLDWLRAELAVPCDRRYLFTHKPLPEIPASDRTLPGQPDIEAVVSVGGVDIVFSGYWHYFLTMEMGRYAQAITGGGGNGLLRHDRREGEKVNHFLVVHRGRMERVAVE